MAKEDTNTFFTSVKWESDENFHFPLAAQTWMNFDSEHFYIRFYQIVPPLVTNLNDLPKEITAKLVAGVAIPISQMESLINAMRDMHEKYLKIAEKANTGVSEHESDSI